MRAFRFYWVVVAGGAVLMALEIVSSRLLAPHFGSSVYVWGSIIGVFLLALSVGYTIGGRLADREPTMARLGRLVLGAALFQGLLLIYGEPMVAMIGQATEGRPTGILLATFVLFGPATIFLGTLSPFAVRLAARDLDHLGDTAGRLYAMSTAGSLAGTLTATFVLIPTLGLRQIFAALLLATAITGLVASGRALFTRREWPFATVAGVLIAVSSIALVPAPPPPGAVHQRITPYQTLAVIDFDGNRYLRSDNVNHAAIRLSDGKPALSYTQVMPAAFLLNPEIESVLVLGMGAGNVGTYLAEQIPHLKIEYVEIDPAVQEVAEDFLGFVEGRDGTVHIHDARRYLAETDRQWDMILVDTYIGLSVPFHLTTVEFFQMARGRLAPGGVFALNLAGGTEQPFARAIYRAMTETFRAPFVFKAPRVANVVAFATAELEQLEQDDLLTRARALDQRYTFRRSFEELATGRIDIDFDTADAVRLTDDYAPVERLLRDSAGEGE